MASFNHLMKNKLDKAREKYFMYRYFGEKPRIAKKYYSEYLKALGDQLQEDYIKDFAEEFTQYMERVEAFEKFLESDAFKEVIRPQDGKRNISDAQRSVSTLKNI